MGESRLELDDDGRVVDGDVATTPADLVHAAEPRGRLRLPRGTGVVALGALVALGLWFALRPVPAPALAATIAGVGLAPSVTADDPLVAIYRVAADAPTSTVEVQGLVGGGVRASTAYPDPAGRGVRIAVVPDCQAAPADDRGFSLAVRVSGPSGASSEGLLPLTDPAVDWAAAIEDHCWTESTRAGITLDSLSATADVPRGLVRVTALLRNSTQRDLEVSAVDVADVATLETAPTASLAAAGSASAAARVTGRCGTASSPPSLSWAIGPLGAAPRLTLSIPLLPDERRTIARAMAVLCSSPPVTSVKVLAATAAPPSSGVAGERGATIDLRLGVSSRAVLVALGDDPSGATADARRAFTYAQLSGPVEGAEVTVRWDVACAAPSASLPLETRTQRLAFRSSIALTGPAVEAAVRAACAPPT